MREEKYAVLVHETVHAANLPREKAEEMASRIAYLSPIVVEQVSGRQVSWQTCLKSIGATA